jgi:uncharacterized membrane protein YeaQ/YmgE (transglycosylase-associated protein family)
MGLIITILLGALVGYIAARLMGRNEGFLASILIGIVGAFVGGLISRLLGVGDQSALAFDLSNLLWALGGSVLVVFILNTLQNKGS